MFKCSTLSAPFDVYLPSNTHMYAFHQRSQSAESIPFMAPVEQVGVHCLTQRHFNSDGHMGCCGYQTSDLLVTGGYLYPPGHHAVPKLLLTSIFGTQHVKSPCGCHPNDHARHAVGPDVPLIMDISILISLTKLQNNSTHSPDILSKPILSGPHKAKPTQYNLSPWKHSPLVCYKYIS